MSISEITTTNGIHARPALTGRILIGSSRFGTLDGLPNTAVARFRVLDGLQSYPLYARGVVAIVLRRYVEAAARKNSELLVTVVVDLLASDTYLIAFAAKIYWLGVDDLRQAVEKKITADKRHVFGDTGLPPDWPRAQMENFTSQETQL